MTSAILFRIAAVLVLLAALVFGEQYIEGLGYDRRAAEDAAAMARQKIEAAATLASETAKTRTAEQALSHFKNAQELKDAADQKTVADLSDRLRRLAGPAGRLRDPQAAGCGPSSSGNPGATAATPGDRADDPSQAGGLLSGGATELLLRLTREADDINAAYTSCRADAYAVRGTAPP